MDFRIATGQADDLTQSEEDELEKLEHDIQEEILTESLLDQNSNYELKFKTESKWGSIVNNFEKFNDDSNKDSNSCQI